MLTVGRLCVKIAGREAGSKCVVVDVIDSTYVTIDGNVRRKRCNVSHLEPLEESITIKKNAPHSEIVEAFKKLNIFSEVKKVKRKAKAKTADKKKPSRKRKIKKKAEPKKEPETKEKSKKQK